MSALTKAIARRFVPQNQTAQVATTAGNLYLLTHWFGATSGSTFALQAGSDRNLTLNGDYVAALNALAAGATQIAIVRETLADGRFVQWQLSLVGTAAAAAPAAPANAIVNAAGDYVLNSTADYILAA